MGGHIPHRFARAPVRLITESILCSVISKFVKPRGAGKEAPMAIITISQGTFSGARMLTEAVSRRLGYRCIDRDQLVDKAAAQWGVSADELRIAFEQPPRFFGQPQRTKYIYLALIQAALAEEARGGNIVYDGLAGHMLLGKGQHVLRTRIIAPMEFRIAMVEYRRQCSRKEAIAYIERMDDDRRKWTRFLYGVDWMDASLYDLVLNLEQMTLVEACDVICLLAQSGCFQTTKETEANLDNLALASRVRAQLALNPDTCELQFEVVAQAGSIAVKGGIDEPAQRKKIRSFVQNIPGVRAVSLEELSVVARF
jgi:cytidylate kinase